MAPSPLRLTIDDTGTVRWVDVDTGRTAPLVRGGDGEPTTVATDDLLQLPDDLTTLTPEDLQAARAAYGAEIDRIRQLEAPTPDDAARMAQVGDAYRALGVERDRRTAEAEEVRRQIADTAAVLETDPVEPGQAPAETEGDNGGGSEGGDNGGEGQPAEQPAPAPAEGAAPAAAEPVAAAVRFPAVPRQPTLNRAMSLAEINAEATATTPELARMGISGTPAMPGRPSSVPEPPELIFNATENVPGVRNGQRLETGEALAQAFMDTASRLPVSAGAMTPTPVASLRRSYGHDWETEPAPRDLDLALRELVNPTRSYAGMAALVAAGGWCAPSEIRYSFFDVAAGPSLWDVPTVGINRGGLRWPISLSLAGFFALSGAPPSGIPSNATMPWLWTESDDIATITGSGAKLCLRPPCPSFDEKRLEAYGICVTNGNFADFAYPELIRHFLGLVAIAHQRVMNRRHLALAQSMATAVTPVVGDVGAATSALLGGAELEATHLREKYGMAAGAVIEGVYPSWVRGVMRSDLTKRMGFNDLAVADAYLMSLFDARNIRAQFVTDWQTLPGAAGPANTIGAASAPTAWPSTVLSLMYAPGTYFLGRGLRIDLGMIRDSVLNAENDHTAAWSEEGTLVGMFGNEALLLTNTICASGETGGQIAVTTCGV